MWNNLLILTIISLFLQRLQNLKLTYLVSIVPRPTLVLKSNCMEKLVHFNNLYIMYGRVML